MSETLEQAAAPEVAPVAEAPEAQREAPAGDSLRDVIRRAYEDSARSERDRDERGRFAPREPVEGPAAETAPEAAAPAADATVERPDTWDEAEWTALTPEARARVAQRERDMRAALEQRADETQEVQHFRQVVAPHEARMKELGITPVQAVERLLTWEQAIRSDPVNALRQLAQSMGVDINSLAQAGAHSQPAQFHDPRLDAILARQDQERQQAEQREAARVQAEIDAFRADSRNVHFDKVRVAMGHLMAARPEMTLKDAYDNAVWADPDLRKERIEAEARARTEAKAKADAEAAARARNAARSVRDSVAAGGVNGHDLDVSNLPLREQIRAAMRAASA